MNLVTKKLLLFLLLAMSTLFLVSGCNTMQGVGEDLEQAGESIEETAEDAAD